MDFQQIGAMVMVLGATGYTLYKFFRILFPGKNNLTGYGCSGCSGSCQVKNSLSGVNIRIRTLK